MANVPVLGQYEWGGVLNDFLATLATIETPQTLSNKTLTAPVLNNAVLRGNTSITPTAVNPTIVPASGWAVHSKAATRFGPLLILTLNIQRTSATPIAVPANGNITNTLVATMPVGYRPVAKVPLPSGDSGRGSSGVVFPNGEVHLCSVAGTNNIVQNEIFSLTGLIPLA